MDVQLKRGMLEICVLAVLCRSDSYGYQLVKDIGPYITVSESTLYPILRRLETTGSLCVYSVEHNGRLRKLEEWKEVMTVYRFITEEMEAVQDDG